MADWISSEQTPRMERPNFMKSKRKSGFQKTVQYFVQKKFHTLFTYKIYCKIFCIVTEALKIQ